jgi:hypothetical protein
MSRKLLRFSGCVCWLLRDVAEGRELGDTSTLVHPGVFEAIRASK